MKFSYPPESRPLEGYTIKRAIQRGGFGEVYYALSDGGKEVALKLLRQNLDVELRGVSQCLNLKHPNLLTIFDIKTDAEGGHWIVMEYVSGRNLDEVIADAAGPMSIEEIQKWLDGMAAGLAYLHDRGIVHRDLKPANIYMDNGVVKIGDVGLAKFISESRRSAQTQSVGTVYYMAPEVAHGRYGRELDIYSLAVMLYEMLTGRVPFDGESTGEILMKHLSERPDLSPLPVRLQPVLGRALEKDPMRRTPSALLLAEEFRAAAAGLEIAEEIPEDSFVGHTVTDTSVAARERAQGAGDRYGGLNPSWSQWEDRSKLGRKARRKARRAARKLRKLDEEMLRQARKIHEKAVRHGIDAARYAAAEVDRAVHRLQGGEKHAARDGVNVERQFETGKCRRPKGEGFWARNECWLKWVIVGVILLGILAPRAFGDVAEAAIIVAFYGALIYGVYKLVNYFSAKGKTVEAGYPTSPPGGAAVHAPVLDPAPAAAAAAAPVAPPPRPVPAYRTVPPPKPVVYTPHSERRIPLRQRMMDLTGSMTFAVGATAAISAVLTLLGLLPDGPAVGMFGVTTLAGSWGVLAAAKFLEGSGLESLFRRLVFAGMGLLLGSGAFWLDQAIMADLWNESWVADSRNYEAAFDYVGYHPLVENGQPTLAAYLLFFGALFAIRRWWWHADAFRAKRFRVRTTLLTALVGFVLPMVFSFPVTWGTLWAAAIACVVQLSASWVPPQQRAQLVEGKTHASAD